MSTFDDERAMQPFMDEFYGRKGFTADRSVSCKQYDLLIKRGELIYKVEEKFLFTRVYDNVLIELLQDAVKPDKGWFYHVDCDWFVWAYCREDRVSQPNKIYMVKWKLLKPFVIQTLKDNNWIKFNICSKNYGVTINMPIEWNALVSNKIATAHNFAAAT